MGVSGGSRAASVRPQEAWERAWNSGFSGRLEVLEHGQPLALGGAKQRAVLAILLLHGERWSRSIDSSTSCGASDRRRLRRRRSGCTSRACARCSAIRSWRPRVAGICSWSIPTQIDADRFAALVADGRAALASGDAAAAVGLLDAALELWRGPPLEEFAYEPFAQAEIARLEDARLATLEDRTDAELRVGRGAELVPELERLVAEHPLRERLIAGLMLALYRAGRQADALAAYRAARERLADELGLEPGPELRELERRILQHDPTLAGPTADRFVALRAAPRSERAWRPGR